LLLLMTRVKTTKGDGSSHIPRDTRSGHGAPVIRLMASDPVRSTHQLTSVYDQIICRSSNGRSMIRKQPCSEVLDALSIEPEAKGGILYIRRGVIKHFISAIHFL
jgi:hypothetical protein